MRQRAYLLERYRAFLSYIGAFSAIIGVLYIVPLLLLLFYPNEVSEIPGFLAAGVPLIVVGLALRMRFKTYTAPNLNFQEATVIIVISWVIAIGFGAVPFMIVSGLDFNQAILESTSGWTSTGLTVVDVSQAPKLILFFRSFIQFAGAAGFAIIAISVMSSMLGAGLTLAEGRSDQLAPHVRQSANIVLRIYIGYAMFGILALRLAGMGWFDAVNHTFAALATGGFSTRVESVAYWDNAMIELVLMVLMILGTINFLVAYLLFRGKFRAVYHSSELRVMFVLILVASLLMFGFVTLNLYPTVEKSVRVAVFEVVSAMTTTGFSSVSYLTWNDFGWMIMIILMIIGGGSGSTAGGIKHFRLYILYKSIMWEIRRAFMPQHMVNEPTMWQGERSSVLNDRQIRQVALFVGLYISVFLIGSGILTAYGYSLKESMFEFSSALSGTGVSVGVTNPNMSPGLLWVLSLGMLLGRLEFYTVIIGVLKLGADLRVMVMPPAVLRKIPGLFKA